MTNIVQDIATLTTLPVSNVEYMTDIVTDTISHSVLEAKLNNEDTSVISLGKIGKLLISITDEELRYKFIPSKYLEDKLITTLNAEESSLEVKVENSLNKRLISVYKDLL